MKKGIHFGVSLGTIGALAALGAASVVFGACSSSSGGGTTPPGDSGTGGEGGGEGGGPNPVACMATPGNFPVANCDNAAVMTPGGCNAPGTAQPCAISDPKCGSTSTCEPFAMNMGTTLNFRIRHLTVSAPANLASTTIQVNVVTHAIDLNAKQCGETGTGAFNWLIQVDKSAMTIKTGGAPIPTDPFGAGFCFINATVSGTPVAPVSGPYTANTDGSFTTQALTTVLNVPIFDSMNPSGPPLAILPIRGGKLDHVTISPDGNCIGSLNVEAFTSANCTDDPSTCSKWNTAGALGGYITLADADNVNISLLNESLCAYLTGMKDMATNKCTAAALASGGDYCSTTNSAGGCKDSFWLASTFAASAVALGGTDPLCTGGPPADAGGGG